MQHLTPQEQQTIDAYNKNASVWAASRNIKDDWAKEKIKFQKYLPKGKILEIGTGGGRDAKALIALGYEYVGTDVSQGLLKEAKKNNPHAKFLLQSVYELDFPKNTFDGFWACAVLLHIPKEKIQEALQSIHTVVKNEGIGFISLKKGEGEHFVESDRFGIQYQRFFSFWQKDAFSKILKQNQFQILEAYELTHAGKPWLSFFVKVVKK